MQSTRPLRSEYAASLALEVGIIRAQVHGWHVGANFAKPGRAIARNRKPAGLVRRIVGTVFAR